MFEYETTSNINNTHIYIYCHLEDRGWSPAVGCFSTTSADNCSSDESLAQPPCFHPDASEWSFKLAADNHCANIPSLPSDGVFKIYFTVVFKQTATLTPRRRALKGRGVKIPQKIKVTYFKVSNLNNLMSFKSLTVEQARQHCNRVRTQMVTRNNK